MNVLPVADLLLQAGASPSLANARGENAITQAQRWHRSEILDLLRKRDVVDDAHE